MDMRVAEQAFVTAMGTAADCLARYGVTVHRVTDRIYRGGSAGIRISVVLDWERIALMVAPRVSDADFGEEMSLNQIMQVIAPEVQFHMLSLHSPVDVGGELSRQISVLLEYCGAFLEGNFTDWEKVVSAYRPYYGPSAGETKEEWADKLRKRAADAFARGDYSDAANGYCALRLRLVALTREEVKDWRQAWRKVEKLRDR